MSSGMKVDPSCITEFNDMKIRKKYKIITYKLNDAKDCIVVDQKVSDEGADFMTLRKVLSETECRYVVYDSKETKRIQFVMWTPDSSIVKEKMTFSASRDCLVKQLDGISNIKELHALDEITKDL